MRRGFGHLRDDLLERAGQVPEAKVVLPAGRNPDNPDPDPYLDITRLRDDTGFVPSIDLAFGIVDYVDWLRTGHTR